MHIMRVDFKFKIRKHIFPPMFSLYVPDPNIDLYIINNPAYLFFWISNDNHKKEQANTEQNLEVGSSPN